MLERLLPCTCLPRGKEVPVGDIRILVVEDEPGLAMTIGDLLRGEGYRVEIAIDGERGLECALGEDAPDLILLDVMLPGIDGFEVCRTLRRRGMRVPVLMLTARGEIQDRVKGLRLGADDYLVKPFDPTELLARIEALLRRAGTVAESEPVCFGDVQVDLRGMVMRRAGAEVELTAMEFQLLAYLIEKEGSVLSRDEILREVWGFQRAPQTRTVDVHITWLRSKIEPDRGSPRYIVTVRGAGYKFCR